MVSDIHDPPLVVAIQLALFEPVIAELLREDEAEMGDNPIERRQIRGLRMVIGGLCVFMLAVGALWVTVQLVILSS